MSYSSSQAAVDSGERASFLLSRINLYTISPFIPNFDAIASIALTFGDWSGRVSHTCQVALLCPVIFASLPYDKSLNSSYLIALALTFPDSVKYIRQSEAMASSPKAKPTRYRPASEPPLLSTYTAPFLG